jgi:hypothetical protein
LQGIFAVDFSLENNQRLKIERHTQNLTSFISNG